MISPTCMTPLTTSDALEQQWRDTAEAMRSEFEAETRSKYPDLDDATIEEFVCRSIKKHVETLRSDHEDSLWRAAMIQKARDKVAEEERARQAERDEMRKDLKRKLDDLQREDEEASHKLKEADAVWQARDETAAGIGLKYSNLCEKLVALGESDIPSAEQVIPNVTAALAGDKAKKDAEEELLKLTPPPAADSSATDLASLEKAVQEMLPYDPEKKALRGGELLKKMARWANSLFKCRQEELKKLCKDLTKYEVELGEWMKKDKDRGPRPKLQQREVCYIRDLIENIRKRLPFEIELPDASDASTSAEAGAQAAQAGTEVAAQLRSFSDCSTQTDETDSPPASAPTVDDIKNSDVYKKLEAALQRSKSESEDKTKKIADMNDLIIAMQNQQQASASNEGPSDDYAGLEQLQVRDDRTLKDAEADLLAVRKQYYKHITTLTHKCTRCKHASKKTQRDACYNQACKDAGVNITKQRMDQSLYFDHNVLARQAGMELHIPPSDASDAASH